MAAKRETPTKAPRKKPVTARSAARPAAAKTATAVKERTPAKAARPAARPRGAAARVARKRPAAAARKTPAAPKAPRTARKSRAVETPLATPGLTEEERIEAAKYLPRDLPKRLFEEERFLFPESYGVTRVRLLVKDPEWLFVHWDVDPKTLESLRSELGERVLALTRLTLRIADPDNGGSQTILLPPASRSWYIRADAGHSRAYQAELGLTFPSGDFRSLTRSNTVVTPRVGPSPESPAPRRRIFGSTAAPAQAARRVAGAGGTATAPAVVEPALAPWKPVPAHADATKPDSGAAGAASSARPATGKAGGGASDAFAPPGASETHRR